MRHLACRLASCRVVSAFWSPLELPTILSHRGRRLWPHLLVTPTVFLNQLAMARALILTVCACGGRSFSAAIETDSGVHIILRTA